MAEWNPRVNEVFLKAFELADPSARSEFLARECGDDHSLRLAVETLLRAHDEAGGFLAEPHPALTGPATLGERARAERSIGTDDFPGQDERVGAVLSSKYKLIEEIGEGGMGSVFMAQQSEPVKRAVAVKVIKAGMNSKAVMARFEAERQALAMMDHPNIARVLDAGTTESGRPFFVMELVKGQPITKFCDERKLTPRQRLELFVPVCQAIQHAHQKGIIHRDIKPSNVLVAMYDDRPVPKVIDFGVAKATGQSLTDKTLMTGFGAVVGTPEYMSPEQANLNNLDIDTRSDVYSLGVLLYELLTGSTPVDRKSLGKAALMEVLRIVREVEAPRPSAKLSSSDTLPSIAACRGTDPSKLSKLMKGELDWVVLKALEKDRTRRYESANGFARDIQRYLADEVVEARPPSAGYRLKKFVRRNKVQVTAVSLVLFALLGGICGTTWGLFEAKWQERQAVEARNEAETKRIEAVDATAAETAAKELEVIHRARAESAYGKTADVLDAMTSKVTGDSLYTQKELSEEQKRFLTGVLTYYKEFAAAKGNDEQTRFRTANAADRVGSIESHLGRKMEAVVAARTASDLYEKLAADFPNVPTYRYRLAVNHHNLGKLSYDLVRWEESKEQYIRALAIEEKLASEFPTETEHRYVLAASHASLGILLNGLEQRTEAKEEYKNALAILGKLSAERPSVTRYRESLARCHINLGSLLLNLVQFAEAKEQYEKGLAIQELLLANYPKVPEYRRFVAMSHNSLGSLLGRQGKSMEARVEFMKALTIQEKLANEFPNVPEYYCDLAKSQYNLANLLKHLGLWAHANEHYMKALSISGKLAAEFPLVPEYRENLARGYSNLAVMLGDLGRNEEAYEQLQKALSINTKLASEFPTVPEYRNQLAANHINFGTQETLLGQREKAKDYFQRALTIYEKSASEFPIVPEYRKLLATSHFNLAALLLNLDREAELMEQIQKPVGNWGAEATEHVQKALSIREKMTVEFPTMPDLRSDLAESHIAQGLLLSRLGKWTEAREEYTKALTILEKLVSEFPNVREYRRHLANGHHHLGALLAGVGQGSEAKEQIRKALGIGEDEVKAPYQRALAIFQKLAADFPTVPEYRNDVARSHYDLGFLLADLKQRTESMVQYQIALTNYEKLVSEFQNVPEYGVKLGGTYCNIGLLESAEGRTAESLPWFDKAIRTLRPIHERNVNDFRARQFLRNTYVNRAITLGRLSKYADSAKDWECVVKLCSHGELARAYFSLGHSLVQAGALSDAEIAFKEALRLAPNDAAMTNYYGYVLREMGQIDAAIEHLTKAAKLDPLSPGPHGNLGHLYWKQKKDLESAEKEYKEAIRLAPNDADFTNGYGRVLRDMGQIDAAIEQFKKATKLDPLYAWPHRDLAFLYWKQKQDLRTAEDEIKEAVRLAATDVELANDYGIFLRDTGKTDPAIEQFKKAVTLDPKYPWPHRNLAFLYWEQKKDLQKAENEFKEAIRLAARNVELANDYGIFLRDTGKTDLAIEQFKKAVTVDPNYHWPHRNLAFLYWEQKKDLRSAEDEFKEAVRLAPKNAEIANDFGILLRDLGKIDLAIEQLKRATSIDPMNTLARTNLSQAERQRELLARLPDILAGRAEPKSPFEACEYAQLCCQPFQKRFTDAVRLYGKAFAADTKLADDLATSRRYDAACHAARAANGEGTDAPMDPADRAVLRGRALTWLRADLALRKKQATSSSASKRKAAADSLNWWLKDSDLNSLRPGLARPEMTAKERADWDALWEDVKLTLAEAQKPALSPDLAPPPREKK